MFLVELVLQGVLGIRELVRLRFQSGFNFIAAGNESGKTTSVKAVQRLLFPSGQPERLDALLSRHTPDASRAALVVCSDDGAYYRIIQDFSKKAVNVSQYNAPKKEFNLLHKDWDHAIQFMSGITSGISERDFEKVFFFRRDHYADRSETHQPLSVAASASQVNKPAAKPAGKAAAGEAKLADLREMLKKAEDAADAEYRAHAAKLALEGIQKKLTGIEEIEGKKEEMEAALEELKGCDALPENLTELIEAQEQRVRQKMIDTDELHKALDSLKMHIASIPSVDLIKDKLFIAGAVLGVSALVAGIGFPVPAEFFLAGVLASLALIAVAWYNGSRKSAQRKAFQQDANGVEKDLVELERRFEQEGASIRASMKAAGATSPEDLKEKADNYRYFLRLRDEIEEQRGRILGDLVPEVLQEEYNKQQLEAVELEKKAQAVAQYNVDTYSIRQDIDRLEAELVPDEASWDLGAPLQEMPAVFSTPAAGGGEAGIHAELGIASRIGGIEMETLVPAVEAAAQRNLSAVTGGKYVRIEVGHDGGPPAVHTKDNSVVNFGELSHGTRDLIYFCIRTGLVEALAGKKRLPFILDDPFASFDPARQKAACQILRSLGAKTQVVLLSSNPALRLEGDSAAELK